MMRPPMKGLFLRSILFPTNILTAFGLIAFTSGYHLILSALPFWLHCWGIPCRRQKRRSERHRHLSRLTVVVLRIIPALPCPYFFHWIPKAEIDDLAIYFDADDGVLEDGGFIFPGKPVLGVAELGEENRSNIEVLPTAPSPTITSFIDIGSTNVITNVKILLWKRIIIPAIFILLLESRTILIVF